MRELPLYTGEEVVGVRCGTPRALAALLRSFRALQTNGADALRINGSNVNALQTKGFNVSALHTKCSNVNASQSNGSNYHASQTNGSNSASRNGFNAPYANGSNAVVGAVGAGTRSYLSVNGSVEEGGAGGVGEEGRIMLGQRWVKGPKVSDEEEAKGHRMSDAEGEGGAADAAVARRSSDAGVENGESGDTTPCGMTGVTLHSHVHYKDGLYPQSGGDARGDAAGGETPSTKRAVLGAIASSAAQGEEGETPNGSKNVKLVPRTNGETPSAVPEGVSGTGSVGAILGQARSGADARQVPSLSHTKCFYSRCATVNSHTNPST